MPGSEDMIFVLTKEDIIACAREMGIPEEAITDDVLYHIKHGVQTALVGCTEVVKAAISYGTRTSRDEKFQFS